MDRRWLAALLVLSLVVNGVFLALWIRERGRETTSSTAVADLNPPGNSAQPSATLLPATPTRKLQPMVAQATRVPATLPDPPATPAPTERPTDAPSPTATPLPEPTETSAPTATPEPPASPTIEAAGTDWLRYVNIFRGEANLPPLVEDTVWSLQSAEHSRYMVMTGDLRHNQDAASPFATRGGQAAAENGNIAAGYIGSDPFQWAFNYWMSAPFHAIPILDPQLHTTGFAEYRDASGVQSVAATMDVRRGLGPLPGDVSFPIMFPRNGGRTWVLRYSLPEFPEALSTCAGYQQPTGAPIILQIGDGRETPQVTGTALFKDGEYLAHCRFDETNYSHPNEFRQKSAREILNQRDAIVIIPQQPLVPDSTYSVRIDVNGATYTWNFDTASGPP